MSKLIVVSYDDELKAEQVRLDFLKMQKSYLVELEDAVVFLFNLLNKKTINLPKKSVL